MNKKFNNTILGLLLIALSSCAPTISDFKSYQKQFMSKSQFMPSEEMLDKKKAKKVVVFELDEGNNHIASQADLGRAIAKNTEGVLAQNKMIELVDRSAAQKLKNEIALSEMSKGAGTYKGPRIADFAISGNISNADFTKKYRASSIFINPKTGTAITIPARLDYKSSVSGNIKIYELPSMRVIETLEFNGDASRSESGGNFFSEYDGASNDNGLVRKAGADAIDDIKESIQNSFAQRGYILEKRVKNKDSIFKINLGIGDGVRNGDKVEIFGSYEVENPLTNKTEIEVRTIATGRISDKIDQSNSWILLDSKGDVNSVRLGDGVKVLYKKSSFSSFARTAQKFSQ